MTDNFQRTGSISNSHVGKEFERKAKTLLKEFDIDVDANVKIPIGIAKLKKDHAFDLGNIDKKIIVECKSHTWTKSDNIPSAKITTWNEAMFYFSLAPNDFRKIFFFLYDYSKKKNESLGEYYLRTHFHLIPDDIEFFEFNEDSNTIKKLNKTI